MLRSPERPATPVVRCSDCCSGIPRSVSAPLTAYSNAGERVASAHPHLAAHPALADRTFAATTAQQLAGHDVVVLALPHGASGAIAAELEALGEVPLILDCGADHRLADPDAWRAYYGSEHAGTWTYGLPELIVRGRARLERDPAARAPRRCHPDRRPRLQRHSGHARHAAWRRHRSRRSQRPGRRARRRLLRRGKGTQDASARVRGSRQRRAVRRRRQPPAHPRDRAEPHDGGRCRRADLVHPGPRPDVARHPRDDDGAARRRRRPRHRARRLGGALRRRAVRATAARGGLARQRRDHGREHGAGAGRRRREGRAASSRSARSTTSSRAPRAARSSR